MILWRPGSEGRTEDAALWEERSASSGPLPTEEQGRESTELPAVPGQHAVKTLWVS